MYRIILMFLLFIFTWQLNAQPIRQKTLERVKQIEQLSHKKVEWLNDHTIEIIDELSGFKTRFDLNIKDVDPDSVDQIIDLTTIDTTQFADMYFLWQTIPLGNAVKNNDPFRDHCNSTINSG